MSLPARVVLASGNRKKLKELREVLASLPFELLAPEDLGGTTFDVDETETTFEGNARLKAVAYARRFGVAALADDSGLEVEALGGAPGVRSARFAGERATDAENNAALLAALDGLAVDAPGARPRDFDARFRCVLALIDPFVQGGEPFVVEGTCAGTITRAPRGSGGFGYDPLFLVEGTNKTMAELTEDEKNRVSHRARATEKLRLVLEKALAARDELTRNVVG